MYIEVKFGEIKTEREKRIHDLVIDFIDMMHEYMVTQKLLEIELEKRIDNGKWNLRV